ncbi:MAG TPA: phosphoribosylformylglycinamidine synthase subunit PurQ [Candidatus Kapabacteria bacterium]|nr:phosphoribosylformylglycinamidine synthase subunit PurQ [Candidatus Kapabacteria bacterium]HPO63849.1 phosphoribosylformylglycinamidine synthase subunit PurQ [Candidatus Kapabacteria bacterium]
MKYGVVVFPGSNCDHDAWWAAKYSAKQQVEFIWHKDNVLPDGLDCVILPGGFSYGDYLRCGSIASHSSIMKEVISFANKGGLVIGICNGFQILIEAELLPGALLRNASLHFVCKDVFLKTMNFSTPFTNKITKDKIIRIPIAHGDGNYFATPELIDELESENSIVFKYCNENGDILESANPNGSLNNIAGIINKRGNVLGMMPHPERYSDIVLGCNDGLNVFESMLNND